jgi:hypothetical protein
VVFADHQKSKTRAPLRSISTAGSRDRFGEALNEGVLTRTASRLLATLLSVCPAGRPTVPGSMILSDERAYDPCLSIRSDDRRPTRGESVRDLLDGDCSRRIRSALYCVRALR